MSDAKAASADSAAATFVANLSRTSPATVAWLQANFEPADGVSLGRETLYKHYCDNCVANNQDFVNQASFGKLIRSVYPNLKTRRLGTRGNSKYHYYGIQLTSTSKLFFSPDQIGGPSRGNVRRTSDKKSKAKSAKPASDPANLNLYINVGTTLPDFPTTELFGDFCRAYHVHCREVLKTVCKAEFARTQNQFMQFWSVTVADSKESLVTPEGLAYVDACDEIFMSSIGKALISDVLAPMPENLTKEIRFFAKCLDPWFKASLEGFAPALLEQKLARVKRLSHTLRRYTSLNHLAGASSPVLSDAAQTKQMITDLSCVDFVAVQAQASVVCDCDETKMSKLQQEFKELLGSQCSLKQWANWLQKIMKDFIGAHPDPYHKAKQFLTRWSFYTSIIIRELTLRSAVSFGSFHLMGLLMDEYLIYIAEQIPTQGMSVFEGTAVAPAAAGVSAAKAVAPVVVKAGDGPPAPVPAPVVGVPAPPPPAMPAAPVAMVVDVKPEGTSAEPPVASQPPAAPAAPST